MQTSNNTDWTLTTYIGCSVCWTETPGTPSTFQTRASVLQSHPGGPVFVPAILTPAVSSAQSLTSHLHASHVEVICEGSVK